MFKSPNLALYLFFFLLSLVLFDSPMMVCSLTWCFYCIIKLWRKEHSPCVNLLKEVFSSSVLRNITPCQSTWPRSILYWSSSIGRWNLLSSGYSVKPNDFGICTPSHSTSYFVHFTFILLFYPYFLSTLIYSLNFYLVYGLYYYKPSQCL